MEESNLRDLKQFSMTLYEALSLFSGGISLIISLISYGKSVQASKDSLKATKTSTELLHRAGAVDLVEAWKDMRRVITVDNKIIGPTAIKAGNALHSTATAWNHDIISKPVLYAQYWGDFKEIYEEIQFDRRLIPGNTITLKSLITPEISRAYSEMKSYELEMVKQTKIDE